MAEYRNILADGDLIRQRKLPSWWLFGEPKWYPHRNLSREVRYLDDRRAQLKAAWQQAEEEYAVAHQNVCMDKGVLMKHKGANSEVYYEMPSDESILSRRDGVKYKGNNSGQKQKGQNNGGGNQQGNGQKGNGNGNNQNQRQKSNNNGGNKKSPPTLRELLDAKVIVH